MIEDRSSCATQQRVARVKMLIAVDRHCTLLNEAGTNAVCAFAFLAPDSARPQPPGVERRIVARRAASLDRDTSPIGKQHATSNAPDTEI
jgi:hypothetical protein